MKYSRRAIAVATESAAASDGTTLQRFGADIRIFDDPSIGVTGNALLKTTVQPIKVFNALKRAIEIGDEVSVVQLVDETWVTRCECVRSESSSSISSSSGVLTCECQGIGFELTLNNDPVMTQEEADDELAAVIAALQAFVIDQEFARRSGYGLNGIVTCVGAEPGGTVEDARMFLHFTCCGVGPDRGDLGHCINTAPGEDFPGDEDLIQNLVDDFIADYGDHSVSEIGNVTCTFRTPEGTGFGDSISCAFSDPVLPFLAFPYERTLEDCCLEAEEVTI